MQTYDLKNSRYLSAVQSSLYTLVSLMVSLGHLAKLLFPVKRPGKSITADWEHFFPFFSIFFFFGGVKIFIIFLPDKKTKTLFLRVALVSRELGFCASVESSMSKHIVNCYKGKT